MYWRFKKIIRKNRKRERKKSWESEKKSRGGEGAILPPGARQQRCWRGTRISHATLDAMLTHPAEQRAGPSSVQMDEACRFVDMGSNICRHGVSCVVWYSDISHLMSDYIETSLYSLPRNMWYYNPTPRIHRKVLQYPCKVRNPKGMVAHLCGPSKHLVLAFGGGWNAPHYIFLGNITLSTTLTSGFIYLVE